MNRILLIAFFLSLSAEQTHGWGATGHRVVGDVASRHLTPKAQKKLNTLLKGESLALIGTWMDEVRSNRKYDFMADWHWVTVPSGHTYDQAEKNPNGDIIESIERTILDLKSKSLTKEKEVETLKILIHLVADIHQPLHVGRGDDRGGNEVKVKWFERSSNLHRVWDSEIIDGTQLSYTELSQSLPRLSKSEMKKLTKTSPRTWATESIALRDQVYYIGEGNLGYEYSYRNLDTIKTRLHQAGIRLALLLNEIYG